MVNKVILIGNLGKDPEVRTLENGAMYAKFSLATNESYKDKNGDWQNITEWHNIIMWRALAESAEKKLKKGSQIYLEGKLTSRSYQDQDGNTKYITEVRANTYRSLDKRESSDQNNTYAASNTNTTVTKKPEPIADDAAADDLPF